MPKLRMLPQPKFAAQPYATEKRIAWFLNRFLNRFLDRFLDGPLAAKTARKARF
jgi:hypothetical protein